MGGVFLEGSRGHSPFMGQEEKTSCGVGVGAWESCSLAEYGQAAISHGAEGWEVCLCGHSAGLGQWAAVGTHRSSRAGLGSLLPRHHHPQLCPTQGCLFRCWCPFQAT